MQPLWYNLKLHFSMPTRVYPLGGCGRPGMWEYAERLWYTRLVTTELNGNKNRQAKFSVLYVDYYIHISSRSLHNIVYIVTCSHFLPRNCSCHYSSPLYSFPLPVQDPTTALCHSQSLAGPSDSCNSVHKFSPHKK